MASVRSSVLRLRRRGVRPLRLGRSRAQRNRKVALSEKERFEEGYNQGYREGVDLGMQSYSIRFEGTSIVIPTYNRLALLKQCITSIIENTDLPYEIIVVDNASTDGTGAYLKKLGGQVRYCLLSANLGVAGAINVGMMMAKGSTILLLNDDTIVTSEWLNNMLACLYSDDNIGMVGPLTNYIPGDQHIEVPYDKIRNMPAFAKEHNRPNPSSWRPTERLIGFCLLFRRELLHQVGYFDEGFEIGSFENDDYNIRVRMLGRSLMVAGDVFIHHYGSASMRALGEELNRVNEHNGNYFMDKWVNPHEWIHRIRKIADDTGRTLPDMRSLYPSHIAVQGFGAAVYWIEDGARRPVEGLPNVPVVRVSQVDLLRWPIAEPIGAWELEARWHETDNPQGYPRGGMSLPDGTTYMIEENKARRVISRAALLSWRLHEKPIRMVEPDALAMLEEGLPIISRPILLQEL